MYLFIYLFLLLLVAYHAFKLFCLTRRVMSIIQLHSVLHPCWSRACCVEHKSRVFHVTSAAAKAAQAGCSFVAQLGRQVVVLLWDLKGRKLLRKGVY